MQLQVHNVPAHRASWKCVQQVQTEWTSSCSAASGHLGCNHLIPFHSSCAQPKRFLHALHCRLAEAFAEKLHELVRKELWGYAPQEALSGEDLLKVKYQVRGPC